MQNQAHFMLPRPMVQAAVRALDWLAERTLPPDQSPAHQRTGQKGEEAAYFHLRKLGYTMVARNFRSPHSRGEIDLIGWDGDTLCFVEVKTRTTRDVKPAEAAEARRRKPPRGRGGPPQTPVNGRRSAGLPAALSTFVSVAIRCSKRILWA